MVGPFVTLISGVRNNLRLDIIPEAPFCAIIVGNLGLYLLAVLVVEASNRIDESDTLETSNLFKVYIAKFVRVDVGCAEDATLLLAVFSNLVSSENKLIHGSESCHRAIVDYLVIGSEILNGDKGLVVVGVLVFVD
ncbi:hypothetical protein HG530_004971 [Fusarium avenaceum]|nr:hypothetical protein HG530_004971 [Fusarium avenaceum]